MESNTSSENQMKSIAKELADFLSSKNPLTIFFGLTKIRELFENIAEQLLSGIEKTYYQERRQDFTKLIESYEKHDYYRLLTISSEKNRAFLQRKARIDAYFEESYWLDPDFFFFVLAKHQDISARFELLKWFFEHPEEQEEFLKQESSGQGKFLQERASKDFFLSPNGIRFFQICIPHLKQIPQNPYEWISYKLVKELYLLMIFTGTQEEKDFWRGEFVESSLLKNALIDCLPSEQLFEITSHLRKKILKPQNYNLDLSKTNPYHTHVERALSIMETGNSQDKYNFLSDLHEKMGEKIRFREQFQNLFRKNMLFQQNYDFLDEIIGTVFIKREIFYETKKRMMDVDSSIYHFESLEQVRELISLLDASFLLRFFRPFYILRLSKVFNKKNELYYVIKFFLTIHSSQTYNEYQVASKFFMALEAFEKKGFHGFFLRSLQFGWGYLALMILFFFFPLGCFLSIMGIGCVHIFTKFIKSRWTDVVLLSNFQITNFLTAFGLIFFVFGFTFALQDNAHILYERYKNIVNYGSLITSRSISEMSFGKLLKGSFAESQFQYTSSPTPIESIDYFGGKTLHELERDSKE